MAVYEYWLAKRKRRGKPILRRLCAPTPIADSNPYNVFRWGQGIWVGISSRSGRWELVRKVLGSAVRKLQPLQLLVALQKCMPSL